MNKLTVGQKVWFIYGRQNTEGPVQVIVTKVGNKYFEIDKLKRDKFYIETLERVSETTTWDRVYLNLQDYLDEKESTKLHSFMREVFSGYTKVKWTLDKLKRIKAIIEEV